MHELSLCQSILKAVEDEFPGEQLEKVREIHLRAGILSGVEPSILQNIFLFMIRSSGLENAVLLIEQPGISAYCQTCEHSFSVEHFVFVCPECGESSSDILTGNELKIFKIILEEYSHEKISC